MIGTRNMCRHFLSAALLVALSSPLLRVEVSSALLLLTPVGALLLAAVVLGQVPSAWQAIGCVLILTSAYWITARAPAT